MITLDSFTVFLHSPNGGQITCRLGMCKETAVSWNPAAKRPNDLEGQGQWPPYLILMKRISWCTFGVNLVIAAQIHDKLLCGQAKFPRILSQNCKNDLEGQGQLERLRSEDTPRRPMITHTIDQFISDPKSKQGESRK